MPAKWLNVTALVLVEVSHLAPVVNGDDEN